MSRKGRSCDAVKDIAVPLTIRVIVEQLGLDQGMEEKISRWSAAVTAQIGSMQTRETMLANAAQIAELQNYLIGKMKEREAKPSEDMISDIVHAETVDADGTVHKLTFDEAVSLIRAMLIAGNDTTATAIGKLFYVLATKPGMAQLLDECIGDDRKLNRFVEEHIRNEPPVRALSRMCIKDTVVNGTTIPEGAHMLLVYASGNDDEISLSRSAQVRHRTAQSRPPRRLRRRPAPLHRHRARADGSEARRDRDRQADEEHQAGDP